MSKQFFFALATALTSLALVAAGCGGSSSGSSSGSSAAMTTSSGAGNAKATVMTSNTSLGTILVASNGKTLYLFKKDTGTKSVCSGACAQAWPPLTVSGTPTAGSGVDQSKLATTQRADGKTQVTYGGHPLYFFVKDTSPGDTSGQGVDGFGAKWWVVAPSGKEITKTSGGGGYGY